MERERRLDSEVEPLTDVELPGEALGEVGGGAARLLLHGLHVHLLLHLVFIIILLLAVIPVLLLILAVIFAKLALGGALLRGWSAEPGEREEERARGGGGRGLAA